MKIRIIHALAMAAFLLNASEARAQSKAATFKIDVAASRDASLNKVVEAAALGGWMVTSNEGGIVTVGPFGLPRDHQMKVTFRATVVGGDSASSVIVAGRWFHELFDRARRDNSTIAAIWASEGEIEKKGRGSMQMARIELERFVAALTATLQPAPPAP